MKFKAGRREEKHFDWLRAAAVNCDPTSFHPPSASIMPIMSPPSIISGSAKLHRALHTPPVRALK